MPSCELMPKKPRGYSRAFTPKSGRSARYLLDKIPAPLWRQVKAKAKREGISIRALLLEGLTEWIDDEKRRFAGRRGGLLREIALTTRVAKGA